GKGHARSHGLDADQTRSGLRGVTSDPQPEHRAADGYDGSVVAERLLVAGREATRLLEEVGRGLELGGCLVQLLVVRPSFGSAAVPRDDLHAVLGVERVAERSAVVGLVCEKAA